MNTSDIVIQLHNLARITTDIGISKELRALADRLAEIDKERKLNDRTTNSSITIQ